MTNSDSKYWNSFILILLIGMIQLGCHSDKVVTDESDPIDLRLDQILELPDDSLKIKLLLLNTQKFAYSNLDYAKELLKNADSISVKLEGLKTPDILITKSYLYIVENKWDDAIISMQAFENCIKTQTNNQYPLYLYSKARLFSHQSNSDSAFVYYDIYLSKSDSSELLYSLFLESKATLYSHLGQYSEAKKTISHAIENSLRNNDSIALASEYKIQADVFYALGDYENAIKSFYQAISFLSKQTSVELLGTIYNNIGNIYSKLDNLNRALDYYYHSLEIYDSLEDEKGIALVYNNLGVIYEKKMLLDSAMQFHQRSLEINNFIDNYKGSAFALANIGSIYQKKNQAEKSINYFEESLKISEDKIDNEGIIVGHLALGSAYYDLNNLDKSEMHLIKSLELSKTAGWAEYSSRNCKLLSDLYHRKSNDSLALIYYQKYTDYLIQFQSYQLTELETKFENVKKEEKINQLNFDKTLQERKIENLRIRWIITVLFSMVVLAFLAVYMRLFFIKNRALIDLANKNIVIAKSAQSNNQTLEAESHLQNDEKYSNSSMDEELKNEIYTAILKQFTEEKIFLQNELNLKKLSDILNTNKLYISQVLSEKTGKHFNNYVNEFRINEARKLIIDGKCDQYTIQTIAEMVGFKSLSSFNKAFKKHTGITPSFLVKQVVRNSSKL